MLLGAIFASTFKEILLLFSPFFIYGRQDDPWPGGTSFYLRVERMPHPFLSLLRQSHVPSRRRFPDSRTFLSDTV